jgi:hypothetical protein
MKIKAVLTFALLVTLLASPKSLGFRLQAASANESPAKAGTPNASLVDRFFRTELYFGLSRPDGSLVTDDQWKDFLDKEVTPRFPDGFTVLDGSGQYRDKNGVITKERSKVLIVLYSKKDRKSSGAKIDEIRAAYVKQFNQESVLRMDIRNSVEVSF